MVATGEATGKLDEVLKSMASFMQVNTELNKSLEMLQHIH